MPSRDDLIEAAAQALRELRLEAERIGDTLNVTQGRGRMAVKANLDMDPLLERLDGVADPVERARHLGGFASGVKGVLAEPPRSKAREWTYEMTAGRMLPNLESDAFLLGVAAASEDEAWHTRFSEDLILTVYVELDRGLRVLTRQQVEAWGATDDRIYSAARSMLFHKTRQARRAPLEQTPRVHELRVGDGFDAARSIVVTEVFFTELDEASFRFAAPHQDALLYVQGTDDEALTQLQAATQAAYAEADYPLSPRLYRLDGNRPATATAVSP